MNEEQGAFMGGGLSFWEEKCVEEVEKTPDIDVELENAKGIAEQRLWLLFQNAATGVTQLYKDRQNNLSIWVPFQTAASSVTSLYKECIESHKPVFDLGYQAGVRRRNKELLSWAKKRKRHIRREDLIAFASGRHHHPPPRLMATSTAAGVVDNVDMFHQALAYSAANMRQPSSPSGRMRGRSSNAPHPADLNSFFSEEMSRHSSPRKRSPSLDVSMDSPKRPRYYD